MNKDFLGWRANESSAINYVNNINQILSNEDNIYNFRNNVGNGYSLILEHLSKEDGQKYFNDIKVNHNSELHLLKKFSKNDEIGNPILYEYDEYKINPTTIRYSKVALDIKNTFEDLNNFNYVEIGAGYGGQVRCLSSIYNFNSIKLFDLPQPLELQKLYLSKFGIDAETYTINNDFEIKPNSILVSNYAWCELDEEYRKIYMDKIINKCKYVFMTVYDVPIEKELENVEGNIKIEIDNFNGCKIIKIKR